MPRKRVQITVSLSADLVAGIDDLVAKGRGRSRSDVVEAWLRRVASSGDDPDMPPHLREEIRFQTEATREPPRPVVGPQTRRRPKRPTK